MHIAPTQPTQANALLAGAIIEEYRDVMQAHQTWQSKADTQCCAGGSDAARVGDTQCCAGGSAAGNVVDTQCCAGGSAAGNVVDTQCCAGSAATPYAPKKKAMSWMDLPRS